MTIINSIENTVAGSSGLSLQTGVSGYIPVSKFNNGTNASSSTYLRYTSGGSPEITWDMYPNIAEGPQYSLAKFATGTTYQISPLVPDSDRSVYIYYLANSTSEATYSSLVLNDGQFPYAFNSGYQNIVAGEFITSDILYAQKGSNSIGLYTTMETLEVTSDVTLGTTAAEWNKIYIANSTSRINFTLSAGMSVLGQRLMILGKGTGGWRLSIGSSGATLGIGAVTATSYVESTDYTDCASFIVFSTNRVVSLGLPQSVGLTIV